MLMDLKAESVRPHPLVTAKPLPREPKREYRIVIETKRNHFYFLEIRMGHREPYCNPNPLVEKP